MDREIVAQEAALDIQPEANLEVLEGGDAAIPTDAPKPIEGLVEVVHWEKPKEFLAYIDSALKRIPPYKRTNAASLERALAYYDHLLSEIRKVLHADLDGDLSVEELDKLEEVRSQIMTSQTQLEEFLKPLERAWKKKGSDEAVVKTAGDCKPEDCVDCPNCGNKVAKTDNKCAKCNAPLVVHASLTKEATTPRMVYVRDPFIDGLARDIINAKVSSGRDIEGAFDLVVKKMKLDEREQYQLIQHIKDIGYPMRRSILNEFGPTNYYA